MTWNLDKRKKGIFAIEENNDVIKKQNGQHVCTILFTGHQSQKSSEKYVILFSQGSLHQTMTEMNLLLLLHIEILLIFRAYYPPPPIGDLTSEIELTFSFKKSLLVGSLGIVWLFARPHLPKWSGVTASCCWIKYATSPSLSLLDCTVSKSPQFWLLHSNLPYPLLFSTAKYMRFKTLGH